jgi:branched-chain amino acid transport system ATP-binding protein
VLSLSGVLTPVRGSVSFGDGQAKSLHRRARAGLGYLAEERSVFMSMSVKENLRVAGVAPSAAYQFFPELEPLANRRTGLLSGGEQQMLALAAVLARKPALLLADELSLGLAPLVVERLLTAVRAAADSGAGVLLVEQHVSSALRYADYVYVLRHGQVVLEGDAAEIKARPGDLEAAYLAADDPAAGGDTAEVSLFVEAATPAEGA